MRVTLALLLAVGVAGFAVYVVLQNSDSVQVELGLHTFGEVRLGVALLGAFLAGAVSSALILSISALRLRFRLLGQRRQIAKLERELHGLRTLPLQEASAREGAPIREV